MFYRLFFLTLVSFCFTTVRAIPSPSFKNHVLLQNSPKAAYYEQQLHLIGFEGAGFIEVYSIIGNKIKEIKTQELKNFKTYLRLESGNMYILRVTISGKIHTLKIIAS